MSQPTLIRCPNVYCPAPQNVKMSYFAVYRVCCEGCGMEGPMAIEKRTKREAARLWNELPRKGRSAEMKTPSEEGASSNEGNRSKLTLARVKV